MLESDLTLRSREFLDIFRRHRGASASELARIAGVQRGTVLWWRSRLRHHLGSHPENFVEVSLPSIADEDAREPESPLTARPLRVHVGVDLSVEVPADFDAAHLRRVLKELRSC